MQTITRILARGSRVQLDQGAGWATVMSHTVGSRPSDGDPDYAHLWYVLELDEGFWSADSENFVSLLVVHADAVHRLVGEED